MGVLATLTKRISGAEKEDPVALEGELAELRAAIETHETDAKRLAGEWLFADSRDAAEQIDRRRREALRLAERDQARIAELEEQLVVAKGEAQRQALAKHRAVMAGLFPRLRAAIDAAGRVQMEAITARNAAIAQLGEGVVAQYLPPVAFLGLLIPDLIQLWASEQERLWAPTNKAATGIAKAGRSASEKRRQWIRRFAGTGAPAKAAASRAAAGPGSARRRDPRRIYQIGRRTSGWHHGAGRRRDQYSQ
jgi:hypothetical protein